MAVGEHNVVLERKEGDALFNIEVFGRTECQRGIRTCIMKWHTRYRKAYADIKDFTT
jgi:hypothetical protein